MQQTVRSLSENAVRASYDVNIPTDRNEPIKLETNKLAEFCKRHVSQIALMGIQIIWTNRMTDNFEIKEKGPKA